MKRNNRTIMIVLPLLLVLATAAGCSSKADTSAPAVIASTVEPSDAEGAVASASAATAESPQASAQPSAEASAAPSASESSWPDAASPSASPAVKGGDSPQPSASHSEANHSAGAEPTASPKSKPSPASGGSAATSPTASPAKPSPSAEASSPAPSAEAEDEAPDSATVEIANYSFAPVTIKIKAGGTIVFKNSDEVAHSVVADDGSFDTGLIDTDKSASVTFDKAGTYSYHCGPHPFMKATIVVVG